jgi:hypothetical protein
VSDRTPADHVRAAVREVRREALKAAIVTAVVDGVLAALLADGLVLVAPVPELGRPVAGPVVAGDVLVLLAGVAVAALQFRRRTRGSAVERFERHNPVVAETLRTARDTVQRREPGADVREADADGEGLVDADDEGRADPPADNPVARSLHETVVDRLQETSSLELLPWRRLALSVVVVAAVSTGTIAMAQHGLQVESPGGPGVDGSATDDRRDEVTTPSSELQSGDEVLGEPTNVTAGDNNESASVGTRPGGTGDEQSTYDRGDPGEGGDGVDPQQAGYSEPDPVEEADLIREYTLELQEDDD